MRRWLGRNVSVRIRGARYSKQLSCRTIITSFGSRALLVVAKSTNAKTSSRSRFCGLSFTPDWPLPNSGIANGSPFPWSCTT